VCAGKLISINCTKPGTNTCNCCATPCTGETNSHCLCYVYQ
jgi:hypothetical protein